MKTSLKIIVLFCFTFLPYFLLVKNYTERNDQYYSKYTHKANHLILGMSAVRRGINPEIISSDLNLNSEILNLGFSATESPFGKQYYDFVKKKLKASTKGIYIISLGVPSISNSEKEIKSGLHRDDKKELIFNNLNPNIEYLLKNPIEISSLVALIKRKGNLKSSDFSKSKCISAIYHRNGWSESKINPIEGCYDWLNREKDYSKGDIIFSKERLLYLEKTIRFLKKKGNVFLVLLPSRGGQKYFYDTKCSWFTPVIEKLAEENSLPLFDLNCYFHESSLDFIDNVHLTGNGANKVSKKIAELIKKELDD